MKWLVYLLSLLVVLGGLPQAMAMSSGFSGHDDIAANALDLDHHGLGLTSAVSQQVDDNDLDSSCSDHGCTHCMVCGALVNSVILLNPSQYVFPPETFSPSWTDQAVLLDTPPPQVHL